MTSQKSLRNNLVLNDFKFGLKSTVLFPILGFLGLFIFLTSPMIGYVTSESFLLQQKHYEYTMYLAENSTIESMFEFFPMAMVVCGMLTAMNAFSFMLSKKQVNVFLSLGVSRKTMFLNRILAGTAELFLAVFIPTFIVYLINVFAFGATLHAFELFLYLTALLFVSGFTGFVMTAVAIVVSGNIAEGFITSVAASIIPVFVVQTFRGLRYAYLYGYTPTSYYENWINAFSPWGMASNITGTMHYNVAYNDHYIITPGRLLRMFDKSMLDKTGALPEDYSVSLAVTLPVILWFAVSVALIFVGVFLYNRRKAEHANSLGKFSVSRAIICTAVITGLSWVLSEMLGYDLPPALFALVWVLILLVVYFVIQLILTRKLKKSLLSLKWCAVVALAGVLTLTVISTEYFGTYNKTPEKSEVEYVSVEMSEHPATPHYIFPTDYNLNYVKSTSDESKKAVLSLFDLLKEDKGEYFEEGFRESITFAIKLKNGEIIYRDFGIFDKDTYAKYLETVYGSAVFDDVLYDYLIADNEDNNVDSSTGYLKNQQWCVANSSGLSSKENTIMVDEVNALCEALYKDLKEMSYEELLQNTQHPICILSASGEYVDYGGQSPVYAQNPVYPFTGPEQTDWEWALEEYCLVSQFIPVYKDMKNTCEFLESQGYLDNVKDLEIKEILYTDSPLSYNMACYDYAEKNQDKWQAGGKWEYYFWEEQNASFNIYEFDVYYVDVIGYFLDETKSRYDVLKLVYKDIGHPLVSVTDKDKIDAIYNKSVPTFTYGGDNGRYVYVVYEEGPIVCYYLPEANVPVIK